MHISQEDFLWLKEKARQSALDYFLFLPVIIGIKKTSIIDIPSAVSLDPFIEIASHFNLCYRRKHIVYENWERVELAADAKGEFLREIYLARSYDDLTAIYDVYPTRKDEYREDVQLHGVLLSYPECCIRSFRPSGTSEGVFRVYKNTVSHPFSRYLNIIWHGQRYISHIPCSFDCVSSIAYAKQLSPYGDASELSGHFLYFIDGSALRFNNVKKEKDNILRFEGVAESSIKTAHPEIMKHLIALLEKGGRIEFADETFGIYREKKLLGRYGGKGKYWIYMEFA
ncbi:MAG: hypothetical protein ACOC32_03665 [Nanoarchaeota archaeon]